MMQRRKERRSFCVPDNVDKRMIVIIADKAAVLLASNINDRRLKT